MTFELNIEGWIRFEPAEARTFRQSVLQANRGPVEKSEMVQLGTEQATGRQVVDNWVERVNWSHSLHGQGEEAVDESG